eukprot:13955740-Alexandrium_andersonii.AAC.1
MLLPKLSQVRCVESVASVEVSCSEQGAVDDRQRSAEDGRVCGIRLLSEGQWLSHRVRRLRPARA